MAEDVAAAHFAVGKLIKAEEWLLVRAVADEQVAVVAGLYVTVAEWHLVFLERAVARIGDADLGRAFGIADLIADVDAVSEPELVTDADLRFFLDAQRALVAPVGMDQPQALLDLVPAAFVAIGVRFGLVGLIRVWLSHFCCRAISCQPVPSALPVITALQGRLVKCSSMSE